MTTTQTELPGATTAVPGGGKSAGNVGGSAAPVFLVPPAASGQARIVLMVPFDLLRLSPNKTHRMHWAVLRRIRQTSATLIEAAYREAGEPSIIPPVAVTLIVRRARRIDDDCAISAFKHARDRLAELLGLPSDGPSWYSADRVLYECGPRWKGQEHFVVVVRSRNNNGDGNPDP